MARVLSALAVAVLLAGPAAIAFFSGGFYDEPRLIAGLVACALLLAAAVVVEHPLPRHWPGRLALGGLAGLALWSALSLTWAPLGGPGLDDAQRLLLYALSLAAAAAWLRPGSPGRAAEPALALGSLLVVGYGLSERVLPELLEFSASRGADGRLEQPLTYWNGMAAIAVVGLVLCMRMAGSQGRSRRLRALAAGAVPTLSAGLYLTFSRGGLAALAAGVLALLALAPGRAQARAVALAALAGAGGLLLAVALPEVKTVSGGQAQGGALLGGLVLLGAAAAGCQAWLATRRDEPAAGSRAQLGRRAGVLLAALGAAVVVAALVAAGSGSDAQRDSAAAGPERLRSLESNRYDYWGVALSSLAANPVAGVGVAGFRVEWLRERELPESVRDAHSLYLETGAELGLVGLALLVAAMAGVGVSARRALRVERATAAGASAALIAWGFHAGLDWDWELPGVTLPAIALAGLLVAAGDRRDERRS